MKIPCEVIVWNVLPVVRRELAKELVTVHEFSQAEVARRFGVTDAAISQYLKKKRGDSFIIEESSLFPQFMAEIKQSAKLIAEDRSSFEFEICRMCGVVKTIGLLQEIYQKHFGIDCVCCRHMGMGVE